MQRNTLISVNQSIRCVCFYRAITKYQTKAILSNKYHVLQSSAVYTISSNDAGILLVLLSRSPDCGSGQAALGVMCAITLRKPDGFTIRVSKSAPQLISSVYNYFRRNVREKCLKRSEVHRKFFIHKHLTNLYVLFRILLRRL